MYQVKQVEWKHLKEQEAHEGKGNYGFENNMLSLDVTERSFLSLKRQETKGVDWTL